MSLQEPNWQNHSKLLVDTHLIAGPEVHGAASPGMEWALPGQRGCPFPLGAGSSYLLSVCEMDERGSQTGWISQRLLVVGSK